MYKFESYEDSPPIIKSNHRRDTSVKEEEKSKALPSKYLQAKRRYF
jgi:hypothetical protein